MRVRQRIGAVAAGVLGAMLPMAARAAEEGSRALPQAASSTIAILATLGAVAVLFTVFALGWLYEQQRGLHWKFQDPDAPAEHH
jgi:hypothetical protein